MSSILITGGAGSFGKALTKHILDNNLYDRVCIFSRDEHKHAVMQNEFNNDVRLRFFIGCCTNKERLTRACAGVETIVHAAAQKRVDSCNYNVLEAVATNINGTANIVSAAIDAKVKKVLLLNTDKAVNPSTIYGYTKAMAGKIFDGAKNYAGENGPIFAQTIYGNVWRSRGSVATIWEEMIANGRVSVPVTNPDMTRFFMTMEEAVELVIESLSKMKGGEIFIPYLPAYRVGDLATAMNVQMDIIGIVPGEKMHEEMRPGETSDLARRMTVEELKGWIKNA